MRNLFLIFFYLFSSLALSIAQAHPDHEDLAAHLKFAGGSVHAHVKWQNPPPKVGPEQTLIVEFKKGTDHTPTAAPGALSVRLKRGADDPKSAGNVTPLNDTAGQPVIGGFVVSGIKFPSPGKWTILVSVAGDSTKSETQSFAIEVK